MAEKKELITPAMQEQISATIWLQDRNVHAMNEEEKEYTRRSLRNLVYTCLLLAKQEEAAKKL